MTLQKISPYLFALTLFLSASLVFFVQPMIGKMMLPFVGGSPAGWAVTMFFFQMCLLCGYALAYIFSKLSPLPNLIGISVIFIAGVFFLPITYTNNAVETITPLIVFMQLTLTTAVPFLALSMISPALQRLFSYSNHATANDPYYLYAASNIGSFTGLLAYPIIFEPLTGLQAQSHIWMVLYGVLFVGLILCALLIFKNKPHLLKLPFLLKNDSNIVDAKVIEDKPITWSRRIKWILMAAIPSSLMIGVTTEITTDIASAPLIWVIPLGLYLVTNIIAFSKRQEINTKMLSMLHAFGVVFILTHQIFAFSLTSSSIIALSTVFIYLAIFYVTALLFHSYIANDRPPADKLTQFYLMLALGGALGGSLNAFIAPYLFNDMYEFQGVLILSLLLNATIKERVPARLNNVLKVILGAVIVIALMLIFTNVANKFLLILLSFFVLTSAINIRYLFIICLITLTTFVISSPSDREYIAVERNFYGVSKVVDSYDFADKKSKVRIFEHGTTLHGFEPEDVNLDYINYGYYSINGPVGDVLKVAPPKDVAILGLGVGIIGCHVQANRQYTYYEIDPLVIDIAKNHFTLLDTCGYKDIIAGDARLKLEKSNDKYDTIFVDVFSSDSIPTHLITTDAIDIYSDKLNDGGTIAIHISNRHLDLTGPLSAVAQEKGYEFRHKFHEDVEKNTYELVSHWAVLTKNKNIIAQLDKRNWQPLKTNLKPWSDDYSNFLSTLKIKKYLNFNRKDHKEEKK